MVTTTSSTARKWWSSGAGDPRCAVYIVMGKTNTEAGRHEQQSMMRRAGQHARHHRQAPAERVRL
jgi:hypothetical protein